MKVEDIFKRVISRYQGLVRNKNWGERGIYFNPPGSKLPLGAYMLTFKEKDGANDKASNISKRPGVFRLNMKISKETFIKMFGSVPARPAAGGIVATGHNFQKLDVVTPHPVYGWMTWISILSPSEETIAKMEKLGLFDEAYNAAVATYNKKTGSKSPLFFAKAPEPKPKAATPAPAPKATAPKPELKSEPPAKRAKKQIKVVDEELLEEPTTAPGM